jgi:TBC1 domain family member 8/9
MLLPWGGGPEPADNEFMRRLFRHWDADHKKCLTLQNLVTGFAAVKGTRDIMTNIAYFFDLYDDDEDGKIDRDGILKMSEALLFLGRRGLDPVIEKSPTSPKITDDSELSTLSKEEQFLSSVSSFIRRCFEYADPDAVAGVQSQKAPPVQEADKHIDQFAIGDDDDEDLVDLGPPSPVITQHSQPSATQESNEVLNLPPVPSESKPNTHAANIALDPAHPLFISLPTFRMVILADEVLESFFDTGFANTFHLADQPIPSSASALASFTTFANIGARAVSVATAGAAGGVVAGGVLPPGKGLRGMLDSIVNDGLRVAGEVRRRMEEAQRELDSAGGAGAQQPQQEESDDESDRDDAGSGATTAVDRRSIRSSDRELLDTAEAEALDNGGTVGEKVAMPNPLDDEPATKAGSAVKGDEKVVEFER